MALGVASACGGDDDAGNAARTAATAAETTTAPRVSSADLMRATLTEDDVPAGFTSKPVDEEDDDDSNVCPQADFDDEGKIAEAKSAFGKGELSEIESSVTAWEPGAIQRNLEKTRTALSECASGTFEVSEGIDVGYTLTELEVPEVGDERVGYRVTIEDVPVFGTMSGDMVVVIRGDVSSAVSVFGAGEAPPAAAGELAERADALLSGITS